MTKIIVFILVLLSIQVPHLFGQKYSKTFFTVSKGLPQSEVTSISEDKINGYLWIGTRGGGLARFDGKTFVTYNLEDGLSSNTISKVFVDKKGNVWAGTRKGLSKFDGQKFKNFYSSSGASVNIVEFNDTIFSLDKNHKLVRVVHDTLYPSISSTHNQIQIQNIFSDSYQWYYQLNSNNILIRRGINSVDYVNLTPLGEIYNLFPFQNQINIISSKGAYIWSLTELKLIEPKLNYPIVLTDQEFKSSWVSNHHNLTKIDRNAILSVTDTLSVNVRVLDCLTDSEGNIWFGTEGKGLIKYSRNIFELVRNGVVTAISGKERELWLATREHGLEVLRNGRVVNRFNLGKHVKVSAIKKTNNKEVWVSGDFGIVRIDSNKRLFSVVDANRVGSVEDIEFDEVKNRLWIGSKAGLSSIEFARGKAIVNDSDLFLEWVLNIKRLPQWNRIMIGTTSGVSEIQDGKITKIVPKFDSTAIYSMVLYKDKYLIIGSEGMGICIYNLENNSTKYYSKNNGLASDIIFFLIVDKENLLWIGSDKGIERIGFNKDFDLQEYLHFTQDHGLEGLESNIGFFNNGKEYFGMVDGLYGFSEIDLDVLPEYPLHFTKVELVNAQFTLEMYAKGNSGLFHIPLYPKLPFDKNSVKFSFAKVSKKYPTTTSYKYLLTGQDKQWSQSTRVPEVTYLNLKPGNYKFKVLARDHNGQWITTPLEYPFTISPPFYLTPLFIVVIFFLAIVAIGGAFYYNVKFRVANLMQQEKIKQDILINVRKEIGIDFHDELGNQLARIINFISLIKMDPSNANLFLVRIEETTKNLISGTKDFIWSLDRQNDTAQNLYIHLKDFGDRLLHEKNIEFRAFYQFQEDVILSVGVGRQVNFIFKEALTNAFKYSTSTQVVLRFEKINSLLSITLTDDGVGISPETLNNSRGGISNMALRSRRIHGVFTIDSDSKGTKISLLLNI